MDVSFNISFDSSNAAFGDNREEALDEVTRIVKEVMTKIQNGREDGVVKDLNGNTIGDWNFYAETAEDD